MMNRPQVEDATDMAAIQTAHLTGSNRMTTFLNGIRKNIWSYLFILPSVALFLAFSVYPMFDTFNLSFQRLRGGQRVWVGLLNYQGLLGDELFLKGLENTVWYFLGMVPIGVLLALILAGLIHLLPSRMLQTLFKAAFYLPIATVSSVILALIWNYLYDPVFGLINYLIGLVGISPQYWLNSVDLAKPSLMLMMHTQWWGGMIILLTASMGAIPPELYDAARIDGASSGRQFFSITLPLVRPAIAYVSIMATISSLRIFNEIFLMTEGGPAWSTANIAYNIWVTGINSFKFGPASSYAMVILLMTVALAVFQYRFVNVEVEY
jgi:multiple sugar transport system permease protein